MARRVLVAGGGIAGLVAARALAGTTEVVCCEAEPRLGGKLETTSFRGRVLDVGPDAFITRDPAALELCGELGLDAELVAPAASSAAIWSRAALRPMPAGLVIGIPTDLDALAASGLVSRLGAFRARFDRVLPGRCAPDDLARRAPLGVDPSVATVVGRRLGGAVLEALVDPLIGGINASDVGALSFAAALPQLAPLVAGKRSITRALAPLLAQARPQTPVFYGLTGGLGRLIEALEHDCRGRNVEFRTSTPVTSLTRRPDGSWLAEIAGVSETFDALVLALPAYAAARLLVEVAEDLARELAAIPYASVATITLAYARAAVPSSLRDLLGRPAKDDAPALAGNGVLVARAGRGLVTAATFTSTKWPHSAAPGEVVIRASVGRHGDERAFGLDDEALTRAVRGELATILGIDAAPLEVVTRRWPDSFPQYVTGHLARRARIGARSASLPGLALCGAAYDGIGIPACIRSAQRAAAQLTSTS